MPHFRNHKARVRMCLEAADWEEQFAQLCDIPLGELISPLFACLPLTAPVCERAAEILGATTAHLAEKRPEQAREIIRRFMWHMNKESGNIGWGVPQAFGATLAHSRKLAEEFASILISYIWRTGKDDNFCDNPVLRRSCFAAVDQLLLAWPDLVGQARLPLQAGLIDEDPICRDLARRTLSCIGCSDLSRLAEL